MEGLFVNRNGKQFAGNVRKSKGKIYKKNTKFFVHAYNGFGIDAELLEQVEAKGYEFVQFSVKEDLENYRKMDRHGRYQVVCAKGQYRISIADLKSKGHLDTLNPKHGEQWFIDVNFTQEA